jgi:hypothetical protein
MREIPQLAPSTNPHVDVGGMVAASHTIGTTLVLMFGLLLEVIKSSDVNSVSSINDLLALHQVMINTDR